MWSTCAREALENLRASGFGWESLLRDYSECREFSIEFAMLAGQLGYTQYAPLIQKMRLISPADELRLLATTAFSEMQALNAAWSANELRTDPPTPVRNALLFGEAIVGADVGKDLPTNARLSLTRSLDYFVGSNQSAPLVGWAFTMVQLLHHVAPDAPVHFDISGGFDGSSCGSATDYAREFWASAQEGLAATARFYGGVFAGLAAATTDFAQAAQFGKLEAMLSVAREPGIGNGEKGRRLEELVAGLLDLPGTELPVLEKRLKHADEELDLVLRNDLQEPFWRSLGSALVIVECKNWSSNVGINELRVLETKMRDRSKLCSVGIFVSLGGFSQPFLQRARDLQGQGLSVFPVDGDDVRRMLQGKVTLSLAQQQWASEDSLEAGVGSRLGEACVSRRGIAQKNSLTHRRSEHWLSGLSLVVLRSAGTSALQPSWGPQR